MNSESIAKEMLNRKSRSCYRIAFLGDSVTQGCFETFEENGRLSTVKDYDAVYHERIRRMAALAFPGCPVSIINAGVGGDNTDAALMRIKSDVLNTNPDVAVVCFGLNDAGREPGRLEKYGNNLGKIFKALKQADIRVIFMTPNMMCTSCIPNAPEDDLLCNISKVCSGTQNDGVMDSFMAKAAEVCNEQNVELCDCYSEWKKLQASGTDISLLLSNGINHPTRDMHDLFAKMLFNVIFSGETVDRNRIMR